MSRLTVSLALLASPVDAWMAGSAPMRAVVASPAASAVTMLWDPTKDEAMEAPLWKAHMLQQ